MNASGRALAELKNLGPATARQLAELVIADETALQQGGPIAANRRAVNSNAT